MSCCWYRWLWKSSIKLKTAICQGLYEYCQNGCITGAQYLVKPNYHLCERVLWYAIFAMGSCIGSILIFSYMKDFSQNTFRFVDEAHYRGQPIQYPSLGICQIGEQNDKDMLMRWEETLNSSLEKEYSQQILNREFTQIGHMMTFQNLYDQKRLKRFLKFTKSLPPHVQKYLETFDFKNVAEQVTYKCEEFFIECSWLGKPFNCCSVFRPMSTIIGKCFLFNSLQTEKTMASQMIEQIDIFREPYLLEVSFSKAAQNIHDVPQNIFSLNNFKITQKGTILKLTFKIIPTLIDASLTDLDSDTLGCVHDDVADKANAKMYAYKSFSTCLTENVYQQQNNICSCINMNAPQSEYKFCNLSQFMCLEENGFINPKSMPSSINKLKQQCPLSCDAATYSVIEQFLSQTTDAGKQNFRTLHFNLYHFPTKHKRRQAIRQAEDKLAAFSNILGLFMGLNVINIIEFIYLTFCAFWK